MNGHASKVPAMWRVRLGHRGSRRGRTLRPPAARAPATSFPRAFPAAVAFLLLVLLLVVAPVTAMAGAAPAPATGAAGKGETRLIPLQPIVDRARAGEIVLLKPGRYAGNVVITKPITLMGDGPREKIVIDAGGRGSVLVLKTDGATVRNLTLVNSGDQYNDLDAGIQVRGNFNIIKDVRIDECLFGIDMQQANSNIIKRNEISSKKSLGLGLRGDGIRLWYSRNNRIRNNTIHHVRDFVIWYSADNIIADNTTTDGRYGLHFMYSRYNLVENNRYLRNSVGIYLMYSDSVVVRNNRVMQAIGAAGIGIGFKEASNIDILDNEVLYNSVGLYLDSSPFQPDTTVRIYRNTIAFNDIGVRFLTNWKGNIFRDNRFMSNIRQVTVSVFETVKRNTWEGNYWDDYQGYDHDGDGFGDSPYRLFVYADRIWMDIKPAAFFKGTPVLTMLDFLERLAPFSDPLLLLEDRKPRISPDFEPITKDYTGGGGNRGKVLQTFGQTTGSSKAGTSLEDFDPFGLKKKDVGRAKP